MNITPTTIEKANRTATKIAVYDTVQKKPVLLFSSIYKCVEYLFSHRIFKVTDIPKFSYIINKKCCQQKQKEDLNIFATSFTYRYANDEQKQLLNDSDYLVLDEKYRNEGYESKGFKHKYKPFELESILAKGDLVAIAFGRLKGFTTEILEIKSKKADTPGSFYYTLEIPGGKYDFKATTLELVEKREYV